MTNITEFGEEKLSKNVICLKGQSKVEKLPVLIKTNNKTLEIICDVVKTPQEIAQGLMGRHSLSRDSGMLFLFTTPTKSNFWMLNTNIPLSIAFFDSEGKILDIQDMHPNTIDPHSPESEFIGALEMNQGWFTTNKIKPGNIINIPNKSYPLMLNEEIYYGNDYGTATHQGIQLDNDGDPRLLPWEDVQEDLISKIHPRVLVQTNKESKTRISQKTSKPKAPDDLPGLGAYLDKYGPSVFQKVETSAKEKLGIGYKEGVDNLTSLFRDAHAWMTPSERQRSLNWYDTEFEPIVGFGERIGLQRPTTAGAVARLSVQAPWFPTSANFPHRGNREESFKLLHVMHKLATTGYHVPKTIVKKNVTIPAGHHTLDTLTDQQIAELPELADSTATYPEHRERAAELIRLDYMGTPTTLSDQIARRNVDKTYPPYAQAPKIISFEKPVLLGPDAAYTTIDRHHINAAANRSIPGSDYNAFRKGATSFITQKRLLQPSGYDWLAALTEDARYISGIEHGKTFQRNPHQAFLWSAQIARFSGEDNLDSVVKGFIRSPEHNLYVPYEHNPTEDCAEFHEFINSK